MKVVLNIHINDSNIGYFYATINLHDTIETQIGYYIRKDKETCSFITIIIFLHINIKKSNYIMEQFEDFYVAWYARSKRFACEYVGDEDAEVMERENLTSIQSERELELRMNFDSLEALDIHFLEEGSIDERLEQALSHLPEKCRIIFEMNKLEGKKQQQIAKDLHISVNTVESQMAIAYKKLRQELLDILLSFVFIFPF